MDFLKCNKCGHLNEVKGEYLVFCSSCGKKLDNNFSDWKKMNPEKSLDDFKKTICISDEDVQKIKQQKKSKRPKNLKYWIGFAVTFAIFYAIGTLGEEKLVGLLRKPAYDKAMMEFASELNKSCPIMVDNATRFDNAMALPNNVFQYNYTLIHLLKDSINIDELKKYLEPNLINFVRTNPDLKIVRDHKTTMNYYYKDMVGIHILTISVKPEQYE